MKTASKVFESIKPTIEIYINGLDSYTPENFKVSFKEDIWSLAQMYEHIIEASNKFHLANTLRCIEQRKGQIGGDKTENGEKIYNHGMMPPIKIKIPGPFQNFKVEENKDIEYYKVALNKLIVDASKFPENLASDAGLYKTEHPFFGFLNANEWYKNFEMHIKHHLRQKTELEGFIK